MQAAAETLAGPSLETLEALLDVTYTWGYQDTREKLRDLYDKAVRAQWISDDVLPWKTDVDLEKRFVARTAEPWFGHDSIFPYAHIMIFKEVLERTASADRKKVGEMMHKIDLKDGPARYFPDGRVKFDDNGRRVGAELCVVQWQKGRPVAVHPKSIAVSKAVWPKS